VSGWLPAPGGVSSSTYCLGCWANHLLVPGTEPTSNSPVSSESYRDCRTSVLEICSVFGLHCLGRVSEVKQAGLWNWPLTTLRMGGAKRLIPLYAFTALTSTTPTSVQIFATRPLELKWNVVFLYETSSLCFSSTIIDGQHVYSIVWHFVQLVILIVGPSIL
jgi:hypothetical protein